MRKILNTSIAVLVLMLTLACKSTNQAQVSKQAEALLTCQLNGTQADQKLHLYQYDGMGFNLMQSVAPDENMHFQVKVPMDGHHQYYYIGTDMRNRKTILLGKESKITMTGNIKQLNSAKMSDSPINTQHDALKATMQQQKNSTNQLMRSYQKNMRNPQKANEVADKLADLDQQKLHLLDSLKTNQPFLAKIAAMNTYLSFPNNKGNYPHEVAYYVNEYFHFVDLTDPDLNRIPPLYEQFRTYTQTLAKVGLTENSLTEAVDKLLLKIPTTAYSYRFALGGVVNGLMQANNSTFVPYGEKYLELYGAEATPQIENLKTKVKTLRKLKVGAEAPDFTANTPEGEAMKLSELRGKIVMIDFWASWCGPCRRENPNVVALYNKYKDKGFEILGVSLDKSRQPWLKAIEKDGLTWHHVSDLKGWRNEVAQIYNVTSIPQTLLLNEEGEIIAKNLRGEQLAQRLAKIFE